MKFTENIDLTVAQKKTTETATENVGRQNDGKEFTKKRNKIANFQMNGNSAVKIILNP